MSTDSSQGSSSSDIENDINSAVDEATDALDESISEMNNMGLDEEMISITDNFVKDYNVLKSDSGSCNYWTGEKIKTNPRMSQRLLTMRRGEGTSNPQQRWRGHISQGPSNDDLKEIYNDNNGIQYKAFLGDFNNGRMNGGPVGGFDYAVCGEAYDEGKHGKERSLERNQARHDDIPTNPFTGDCLGVNETEFKKVIGEQKCKSANQMKSEVEFLVCPPKIKDEGQSCIIKSCPGSGKYKGMKMDLAICKNSSDTQTTIEIPKKKGSQWECESKIITDSNCPSTTNINDSFDALFNKKGVGTDGEPTVQWDTKSYLNRQSHFFSNYSPCLNFGSGGGDETSKSETGETIGGEGIFYDELELQNRRNAATFGWYNMVDSGFTQNSQGDWEHSGNKTYKVGDAVWVLVIPENENGETDGKMNARWLQGKIGAVSGRSTHQYLVELDPTDLGSIPHPSRTRRPYPKDKEVLNGVHWKRLRRREKSDSSKKSPLDQIWLHSVCGKQGSYTLNTRNPTKFEKEDNHGIPRVPGVSLGCNGFDYNNHYSYDCYNAEKAYSTIPMLLMQRYFQGARGKGWGLGWCSNTGDKGNAMNRWIEWCHKYKQTGKSEDRIVRNYLWNKPVGTYKDSYQDYVDPEKGNCGTNGYYGSTFNKVLEDWKTWGGVYPHTTMNPKNFGSTDGQGWGWYTGNKHVNRWDSSTYLNSTSAVSLLGHKTEKKIKEGGDTLTEDGWSNRTPEFIEEENSLKILGDNHNKDTRKSVGLTSCVKSSVGNGGKFPYLKRDRLIFDKNIRSNTLYPSEISTTTGTIQNLEKGGEGKEVGKGGMFRGCMRSPEDYDAKNILNCCITGRPYKDKIGGTRNRENTGSCPMDYCVNIVRSDSLTAAARNKSIGCSQGNMNDAFNLGGTSVCQAMSEQCVNIGEQICSNPDIQGDINVENLCKAWGKIQPTKYNNILDRKCLWFLDKTNPEAQKLNNLTKDNLSSSKSALISLYNTLGVGTSCAGQVRDSLDSPQTAGKMADFCKGTVKQKYGLCIPVPKNQCRPIDPTKINEKMRCIKHHGKENDCNGEKDNTTKKSICRYTGPPGPLPKTCSVKPGSSDPTGECKSLNGLSKKECETNKKCIYKQPKVTSDNIYDICNNQKNDPMICEQHRDCMWVSNDKDGNPVNRLTPNNKPYWEKTFKGSLLSKTIENIDHLESADTIPLDKPDSINGFGFDICGCHFGKKYNEWYKKNKLGAGQEKDVDKLVLNQPPQCWMHDCSNSGWIPTSRTGHYNNICPNIIQCIQTQIQNTYTSGGLSRQSRKKAGSQNCTANLEITNVRGGNDLSSPEDEETAAIYDAINKKVEDKSGIKNTKGGAKGGEKSTPKTTAEKEEAQKEESNTWIVFSIIGGVILLFIILFIILSLKNK